MPASKITDVKIISGDETYHGWPTVGRRRNGELLAVVSAGREEHVDPFGKLYLYRSSDSGATWSAPRILVDGPYDDRDAGIIETSRGTLLVNWFNSLAWLNYLYRQETGQIDWVSPETCARWRPTRDRLATTVKPRIELGDWMIRSTDGGKTWSERYATGVNSPHGPIELKSGRLIYAGKRTVEPRLWTRGSAHEQGNVGVSISDDDGLTWNWHGEVPFTPGHTTDSYHEPHLAEAADGTLIMHIRNHNAPWQGETLQSESSDGGRTWSVPHGIGIWGQPAHLLRLANGRLLTTYGYRRNPFGNQARISADCGKSWSKALIISSDGEGPDLGYPSTAELEDGTFVTVWYEHMRVARRAVLRQARWRLEG